MNIGKKDLDYSGWIPPIRVECIITTVCQPLPLPHNPHFIPPLTIIILLRRERMGRKWYWLKERLDGSMVAVMASSVVGQET